MVHREVDQTPLSAVFLHQLLVELPLLGLDQSMIEDHVAAGLQVFHQLPVDLIESAGRVIIDQTKPAPSDATTPSDSSAFA